MTYAFGEVTVTTWGHDSHGRQTWQASAHGRSVEFTADRNSDPAWLYNAAAVLLGLPITENGHDILDLGPRVPVDDGSWPT